MGNTYPNHKGNYYYRNHTLYHTGTLDPLGFWRDDKQALRAYSARQGDRFHTPTRLERSKLRLTDGIGFRAWGLGFRVQGWGLGFGV